MKEISAYFSVSIDDLLSGDKKAEKGQKMAAIGSVILSVLAVLLLALAGETYAVVVAFLLLLIKGILLFKGNKNS